MRTLVPIAMLASLALVGAQGCGQDCTKLGNELSAAVGAFTPVSSNACSTAADCTLVHDWVSRDGHLCWGGCGAVFSNAAAPEYTAFLDNDPKVTATCKAYLNASCAGKQPPGPGPACPAVIPVCTAGQCGVGFPGSGG